MLKTVSASSVCCVCRWCRDYLRKAKLKAGLKLRVDSRGMLTQTSRGRHLSDHVVNHRGQRRHHLRVPHGVETFARQDIPLAPRPGGSIAGEHAVANHLRKPGRTDCLAAELELGLEERCDVFSI